MKSYWIRGGVSALSIMAGIFLVLGGCSSGGSGDTPPAAPPPPVSVTLTIEKTGAGIGTITSNPAGVNCGATCTLTVTSGTVVTLTAAPAPNNTLADWSGACATASATCAVTVTANQTITATFNTSSANPSFGITLAGTGAGTVTCNGGACNATYPWGTSVTLSGVPQAGSAFVGWSGGGCTGTAECTVLLWGDTAVTATFNTLPVTAQLSVTKNGTGSGTVISSPAGINCGATCSADFPGGALVTLTAAPTAGSTFTGWSGGGCAGTGTCDVTLNANTAVTATFNTVPPTSSLTVTIAGTGTGTVTCNGATCNPSYPSGTALTIVATPAATSLFSGWGGACASAGTVNTCNLTINANSTLSATFNLPTLSVVVAGTGTVTSNPADINCGATCTASFNKGTSITLTAAGANFSGWTGGGCSGTGTCILTLTQNTTVTANFSSPPGTAWTEEAYLKAQTPGMGESFGNSLAVSGDMVAVGKMTGEVSIFSRNSATSQWSRSSVLPLGILKGQSSLALDGNTLAVAGILEPATNTALKVVNLYTQSTPGAWVYDRSILPPYSGCWGCNAPGNTEGVILSGSTLVLNDIGIFTAGAVAIYRRDSSGFWGLPTVLTAPVATVGDYFGWASSLSGDILAVAASVPFGPGSVYVFTYNPNTGTWSQPQQLTLPNPPLGGGFGSSVAVSGDLLAVGSPSENAVYLFARDPTGGTWMQTKKLSGGNSVGGFGSSVGLAGGTLVVGSISTLSPLGQYGHVHVFTKDTAGSWIKEARVAASNADNGDWFGTHLIFDGTTILVGARSEAGNGIDPADNSVQLAGAAYVYRAH